MTRLEAMRAILNAEPVPSVPSWKVTRVERYQLPRPLTLAQWLARYAPERAA